LMRVGLAWHRRRRSGRRAPRSRLPRAVWWLSRILHRGSSLRRLPGILHRGHGLRRLPRILHRWCWSRRRWLLRRILAGRRSSPGWRGLRGRAIGIVGWLPLRSPRSAWRRGRRRLPGRWEIALRRRKSEWRSRLRVRLPRRTIVDHGRRNARRRWRGAWLGRPVRRNAEGTVTTRRFVHDSLLPLLGGTGRAGGSRSRETRDRKTGRKRECGWNRQ
jgi:hypothetical protein